MNSPTPLECATVQELISELGNRTNASLVAFEWKHPEAGGPNVIVYTTGSPTFGLGLACYAGAVLQSSLLAASQQPPPQEGAP